MYCVAPSIPVSMNMCSYSVPQASIDSESTTNKMYYTISCLHVYPNPTGMMIGCLLKSMRLTDIRSPYGAQGGRWFDIPSLKGARIIRSYVLTSLKHKS